MATCAVSYGYPIYGPSSTGTNEYGSFSFSISALDNNTRYAKTGSVSVSYKGAGDRKGVVVDPSFDGGGGIGDVQ